MSTHVVASYLPKPTFTSAIMFTARAAARSSKLFSAISSTSRFTSAGLYKSTTSARPITCGTRLYKDDKRTSSAASRVLEDNAHEGAFGRTDNTIRIEHPGEEDHPPSKPVQGRGGLHFKRTLASFTLEKRVAVVTGGARGLGLVMSQACVISGADVAIVDLNSESMASCFRYSLIIYRGRRAATS